jgi:hypothetical protein
MERKLHIYKEFIPSVVKSLVSRTKGLGADEYTHAVKCLDTGLSIIATNFGNDEVSYFSLLSCKFFTHGCS